MSKLDPHRVKVGDAEKRKASVRQQTYSRDGTTKIASIVYTIGWVSNVRGYAGNRVCKIIGTAMMHTRI